ncbi:MAG: FtsX-like permease family protein [Pseudomonadota bacterium]
MIIKLACQQLFSQWKSGDLRVMLMALVLAVTSITAVNFFINRIALHLNAQGGLLLGGDLVVISDHAIPQSYQQLAKQYGLQSTSTLEFPSMVINGELNQLAEIKALSDGFPLRGDFGVQLSNNQLPVSVQNTPEKGEVWVEPRLVNTLKLAIGDSIELGATRFKIAGILAREPSRGGDMFSFAPRLMMHADDIAATQLVQFGSRVKYQLLVAGASDKVTQFSSEITPKLQRGERVEDVKTARPEIKSALDKAETFLSLSAFASVVLSIVAMLLASIPFIARCTDTAALMRCFGASKANIQKLMLLQSAYLAVIGGLLGCLLGYILQHGLAYIAGRLFLEALPSPNFTPILMGLSLAFAILFSIMLPHIQALKNVPIMRILRHDYAEQSVSLWLKYSPILIVIILLMFLLAKTLQLAFVYLAGILGICLVAGLLAYGLAKMLKKISQQTDDNKNYAIKLGFANLNRRLGLSIAQIIGFSLGAMVLMLLMMIKTDLMQSWRASLPVDAPNRFIINIQPDQVSSTEAFLQDIGVGKPQVFPMIRGRLTAINNQAVSPDSFKEERAKRLASREFNLSSAAQMQSDNKLLQGRWWQADEAAKPFLSLEEDIATALNIKLGDTLTYDIAGSKITLTVTSIRKVEWDSMRANFFAVTPVDTLKNYPTSYMTAFYLPKNQDSALNQLVQKFPNFTVIDVANLMNQVRDIMNKLALAIGFVFMFCLVAGLVVLYAALIATLDARLQESALLRVLGASRAQTTIATLTEFASIGMVAATVAIIMATGLSYYLSTFVLDIPYQFNVSLALGVFLLTFVLIPFAAWLVIRRYLNVPPKQLLNSI